MKPIDGNRLVEVLSLPSHDKRVLSLLKELGLKRPVKDENYNYVAIVLTDPTGAGSFEIDFDEDCETEKQKNGAYGNVDFYLNAIAINNNIKISPPFGIDWDNSYEICKRKLNKKADFQNKKGDKLWLLSDNEKEYILNISFLDDGTIKRYIILPFNTDRKYVLIKNEE